jgi:hypothetical protein
MRKNVDLLIYIGSVEAFEPFDKLEFRAVKERKYGDEFLVEWAVEGEHDYYGLYAHSRNKSRWTCIADCDSKLKLMELAQMLNAFAGYSLEVVNKINVLDSNTVSHRFKNY